MYIKLFFLFSYIDVIVKKKTKEGVINCKYSMPTQIIKKAISIIVVSSLILCNVYTSRVISASGTATGMIFAATGMTSTATYKASEKFIQGKDVSFEEATTDIANVGYAGYFIGNIVSIIATILNEYTGIVDKGIKYFNKKQNTNLSTSMNIADTHSAAKTCENFSNNVINKKADFYVAPSGNVYKYKVYPENDGALSSWKPTVLQSGTIIDRYGESTGKYFSPVGTPIEQRALPPWTDFNEYHKYEVIKDLDFQTSTIAPFYDQPGGGIQYWSDKTVDTLINIGMLKEIFGD